MQEHNPISPHNTSSRAVAHNSRATGLALQRQQASKDERFLVHPQQGAGTVSTQTGAGVIQGCWITTGNKVALYPSATSQLAFFTLSAGVQVKRLDKTMHNGRYYIEVETGDYKAKTGYIQNSQMQKVSEKSAEVEKKKEVNKQEKEPASTPSAFDRMLQSQHSKKAEREAANRWSSQVPQEMKEDDKMNVEFQDKFGGSADIYTPFKTTAFDTPPSSPSIHENEHRRLATPQEQANSLIINFGLPQAVQDTTRYGGNYNQYTLYSNNTSYSVNQEDRHHVRLSSYLFNEAAQQTPSGILKAQHLSDAEEKEKTNYLKAVREKMNKEGQGGTFLHEPDQQFVSTDHPVRSKGGSMMGTHFGTRTANSVVGQPLHPKHPQHQKATQGVSGMLVKEQDQKVYRYGAYEKGTDEVSGDIIASLKREGWNTGELSRYLLDVTAGMDTVTSVEEARELMTHYYTIDKVGPTKKDFDKVQHLIDKYVQGQINAEKFKTKVAARLM